MCHWMPYALVSFVICNYVVLYCNFLKLVTIFRYCIRYEAMMLCLYKWWLSYRVNDHVILVNNMEVTNVDKRTVLQAMKGSGGHINMVSVVMEMIVLPIQLHVSSINCMPN